LVASVCDYIFYDKAKSYVQEMQDKGSIPYSTFRKEGSNCSRIVTDTIIKSTDKSKIKTPLLRNKIFTPSPLGNVDKGAMENKIYQVEKGVLIEYPHSVFVENLTNYFDKKLPVIEDKKKAEFPDFLQEADFLSGTGSGAYFLLTTTPEKSVFEISRYTEYGEEDFRGFFETKSNFDPTIKYQFVYDSRFDLVKRIN